MTVLYEQSGSNVTQDQLEAICKTLGYDPTDVSAIHTTPKEVTVEVFARLPYAKLGYQRFLAETSDGYVKARFTHQVARSTATEEESR